MEFISNWMRWNISRRSDALGLTKICWTLCSTSPERGLMSKWLPVSRRAESWTWLGRTPWYAKLWPPLGNVEGKEFVRPLAWKNKGKLEIRTLNLPHLLSPPRTWAGHPFVSSAASWGSTLPPYSKGKEPQLSSIAPCLFLPTSYFLSHCDFGITSRLP